MDWIIGLYENEDNLKMERVYCLGNVLQFDSFYMHCTKKKKSRKNLEATKLVKKKYCQI